MASTLKSNDGPRNAPAPPTTAAASAQSLPAPPPLTPVEQFLANVDGRWYAGLWLAVLLYSGATLFGHHHVDEIGQITAFYLHKIGLQPAAHMPWEFGQQMRPWLQPALYYMLVSPIIDTFGFNYYVLERVTIFSQVILLLGALGLSWPMWRPQTMAQQQARWHPVLLWGQIYVAATWFMPSMLIRHSSEAMGSICLIAALGAWHRIEPKDGQSNNATATQYWALASGLASGLAFWMRFQTAFFVAGFWFARLVFELRRPRGVRAALALFALGVILTFPLGMAADSWGYGEAVFSPWNYFLQNVTQGRASVFGVSPWYEYLTRSIIFTGNPLLWIWLVAAAIILRKNPWYFSIAGGFFLFWAGHTAVGHKEIRFLVPAVAPALLLLLGLFEQVANTSRSTPTTNNTSTTELGKTDIGHNRWGSMLSRLRILWDRLVQIGLTRKYMRAIAVANVVVLIVFTLVGLVRDRNRLELVMRDLPRDTTLFSVAPVFANFGIAIPDLTPEDLATPSKGKRLLTTMVRIDEKLHERTDLHVRRAFTFAIPAHVALFNVPMTQLPQQCHANPQALVLLTNQTLEERPLLKRDWRRTIAEFPPAFIANAPFEWAQRVWQFKIIPCAELIGS